jgi:1,5-anhydro-D-fructose reductase (1,5-anhydro-D-mannitol-forming)
MINVGIIGFGKMGRIRFQAIQDSGKARVVGIVDPAGRVAGVGMPVLSDAERLISDPSIDALIICTPNFLNQPLTMRALRAGKHVFCEKPPAMNAGEVEEVRRVEAESGLLVMYGFNHRQHGSILKAKELLDSGQYGRLLWMRGRYGKSVSDDFYQTWRAKRQFAGGGILMDQGIHMLDLFLLMAGDFDEVQAFVSNLYWHLDVEDNVFAMFRNRNGVVASLHSTMTQWRHLFSFEMFLEKGYMAINGMLTSSKTYGEEVLVVAQNRTAAPAATWHDSETFTYPVDSSWQIEIEHFLWAIETGSPVAFGGTAEALKLMRLVDKIYAADRAIART